MFVSVKFFKFEFLMFFHSTKVNNCLSLNFKNLFFFMKKGTKLYSIMKFRCPVCHEGDFLEGHPYSIKHLGDVRQKCNSCGQPYSKEPGFYFGAMYVAYALGVALFVAVWLFTYLFFPSLSSFWNIFIVALLSLLLAPYFFSLSKIIYANFFFKYKSNKK